MSPAAFTREGGLAVGAAVSLSLWIKLLKEAHSSPPAYLLYSLSLSPSFWGRVVAVDTVILVGADTATTALHLILNAGHP